MSQKCGKIILLYVVDFVEKAICGNFGSEHNFFGVGHYCNVFKQLWITIYIPTDVSFVNESHGGKRRIYSM